MRTLVSWNVNGIRAAAKKGFLQWLHHHRYDLVSLQETKISSDTVLPEELKNPNSYTSYWDYATDKKGYSGVACYAAQDFLPQAVNTKFSEPVLAREGRLLELDYGNFVFLNVYFPNGKRDEERLKYKLEFYEKFLAHTLKLTKKGKGVIFCGDVNTAHKEIDLARPKENSKISGFLPIERAWIDRVIERGFVDTFRLFTKEGGHYSWWDQLTRARERNVGWRIDYFFVSDDLAPKVKKAFISPEVMGSDHCPVGITIDL